MNKLITFILFCFVLIQCNTSETKNNAAITIEEKKIAKDLIQGAFDDLWAAADSTKILDYHTKDFIILEQGEIWDNNRIKQFMRSKLAREKQYKRINKMDYISIEKYGKSMQIAYWNDADFYDQDSLAFQAKWLESAVAIKAEEGWRLKMMHSSRVNK
jgi:nuclear transport factor 2 (NTF2) superfamily protein